MSERSTGITQSELDLSGPPALTAQEEAQLAALRRLPDDSIDTSDIPSTPSHLAWSRPGKGIAAKVTLDADVSAFFEPAGEHRQQRVNEILREYIAAHPESA